MLKYHKALGKKLFLNIVVYVQIVLNHLPEGRKEKIEKRKESVVVPDMLCLSGAAYSVDGRNCL